MQKPQGILKVAFKYYFVDFVCKRKEEGEAPPKSWTHLTGHPNSVFVAKHFVCKGKELLTDKASKIVFDFVAKELPHLKSMWQVIKVFMSFISIFVYMFQ